MCEFQNPCSTIRVPLLRTLRRKIGRQSIGLVDSAAARMQAVYRGKATRKSNDESQSAASMMQAVYRGRQVGT